jgi:hypothetical protein
VLGPLRDLLVHDLGLDLEVERFLDRRLFAVVDLQTDLSM